MGKILLWFTMASCFSYQQKHHHRQVSSMSINTNALPSPIHLFFWFHTPISTWQDQCKYTHVLLADL